VATAALYTYTVNPWVSDLTISPVPDGQYAVCVSAIDWAQNAAWTNETTGNPVITVDNYPAYANATGPVASVIYTFDVTYDYVADPIPSSGMLNISLWYSLDGGAWTWFAEDPTPGDGLFPVDVTALGDGTYEWFMAAFDMAENHEALLFVAETTTIVDTTSPYVVTTVPMDGAIDVALAAGTYVIEFSEPMDTGVGTVTTDLPGVTWTWSANAMWYNGTYTDLTESTTYNVDISAGGFTDALGNALIEGLYGWTFTFTTVGVPPEVVTTTPLDGATDVPMTAGTYVIQFNEPMDIGVGTVTTDLPGIIWTWSADAMWYNGTYTDLAESTIYTVDISLGGFTDIYGNTLVEGAYGWIFTFTTVGIPPEITMTAPFDGENGVLLGANVVITFSEPIDTATISYSCNPDPLGWSEAWSAGDTVLTLSHNDFSEFFQYTFTVTYAEDLFGNLLVAGAVPNPWTFQTAGTFNLDYSTGWNLLGIPVLDPMVGGTPLNSASDLAGLGASMVSKWDFATQRYVNFIAGFHLPGEPRDFVLMPDEAYWAWMPAAGTLTISGSYPGPRNLAVNGPGWNMVSYMDPLTVGDVDTDWAPFVSYGAFDDIAYYDNLNKTFVHYIFSGTVMELVPGRGYFVWSDAPSVIPYGGGIPGPFQNSNGNTYWNVQDAIDDASPGDTINFDDGTYVDSFTVDKPLTLQGSGSGTSIGTGPVPMATASTVIDANGANYCIRVTSDNVVIQGLRLQNAQQAGLYLDYADYCTVQNVAAVDTNLGFYLAGSHQNDILSVSASGNQIGIVLSGSTQNLLDNVNCNNNDFGVRLSNSDDNMISGGMFWSNGYGIHIAGSNDLVVSEAEVQGNVNYGLWLDGDSNAITWNDIYSNGHGIYIDGGSEYNDVVANEIYSNGVGIEVEYLANLNEIYQNNIVGNTVQALDDGVNTWSLALPDGGNHWDDWTAPDADSDGVVDAPYIIGINNQDDFPWASANGWESYTPPPPPPAIQNVNTGEAFDTIQDAINDSNTVAGHKIKVQDGVYYGNLILNKAITLEGSGANTILDANNIGSVVKIKANGATLTGFTIRHSGNGWDPEDHNDACVVIKGYNGNTVSNNFLTESNTNMRVGVYMENADNNHIINNDITMMNNLIYLMQNCDYNTIQGNNIYASANGIKLGPYCTFNQILDNTIEGLAATGIGVTEYSDSNTISGNAINNCYDGIRLDEANSNTISYNTVSNCKAAGIDLYSSVGGYYDRCKFNNIHHNNLIGNAYLYYKQASDTRSDENTWDSNYWSDWAANPGFVSGCYEIYDTSGYGAVSHDFNPAPTPWL
jgi:parallel beta-helix repeat protein